MTTNTDYRYVEANDSTNFRVVVDGWLVLAEKMSPGTPKGVMEGDYVAHLPDGSRFQEVSFIRVQTAVQNALAPWAESVSRRFSRIDGEHFAVSDGTQVSVEDIRWEEIP